MGIVSGHWPGLVGGRQSCVQLTLVTFQKTPNHPNNLPYQPIHGCNKFHLAPLFLFPSFRMRQSSRRRKSYMARAVPMMLTMAPQTAIWLASLQTLTSSWPSCSSDIPKPPLPMAENTKKSSLPPRNGFRPHASLSFLLNHRPIFPQKKQLEKCPTKISM